MSDSLTDGNVLYGQQYDEQADLVIPFTEQTQRFNAEGQAAGVGQARTEVLPVDVGASKVRVFTALSEAAIDSLAVTLYENISFQLPDTLNGVTAYYTKAGVDGSSNETGDGSSVGATGALSINLSASSQGSAVVVADVFIDITPRTAVDVPCAVYLFYMLDTSTRAQILTKVGSLAGTPVNDWPQFRPKSNTLFILGQHVDLSVRASLAQQATVTDSTSAWSNSAGTAVSKSKGVTFKVVTLPPTIHGAISITNGGTAGTQTQDVTVESEVQVTRTTAGWLTATLWPARTVNPGAQTDTAAATVWSEALNGTIPTTGGTTAVPTSGLYARLQTQPWKFGLMQIRAEVVNFANF